MGRNRIVQRSSTLPLATANCAHPGNNADAVVTYAAVSTVTAATAPLGAPVPAGRAIPQTVSHVITGFLAQISSNAALTTDTVPVVTLYDGAVSSGNTVFEGVLAEKATGASQVIVYELDVKFPLPVKGTAGNAMNIKIPAAGNNTVAKINVYGHWTEIN